MQQSLHNLDLPKKEKKFFEEVLERSFNYLVFGQNDFPEDSEYILQIYPDSKGCYEGEVNQAGQRSGRGMNFEKTEYGFIIAEGFWEGDIFDGLGRIIEYTGSFMKVIFGKFKGYQIIDIAKIYSSDD